MKSIMYVFITLTLIGCTVSIYQNSNRPNNLKLPPDELFLNKCGERKPPVRSVSLSLPIINPKYRHDDKYMANKLLDHIQLLTNHITSMDTYISECIR